MKSFSKSAVLAVLLLSAIPTASWSAGAAPDISGIWWANRYHPELRPEGGGALPFTPAGAEAFRKNVAGLKDGSIADTARTVCTPDGVPRVLATVYPFQIFQSPGFVTIVYEQNHVIRTIPLDRPIPKDDDLVAYPNYSGNSFGHFEGDTLVVLTKVFKDKTFIDGTGVPHSDQLHVTERFRRVDGGKGLEIVASVEDPAMFTRPWTVRFDYELHPELRIDTGYICGEKHRDISRVRGVPK